MSITDIASLARQRNNFSADPNFSQPRGYGSVVGAYRVSCVVQAMANQSERGKLVTQGQPAS